MQVAVDSGVQKNGIYIYINYLNYLLSKMLVHMENQTQHEYIFESMKTFHFKVMFLKVSYIA